MIRGGRFDKVGTTLRHGDCIRVLTGDDAGWQGYQCWTGGAGLDCVTVSEYCVYKGDFDPLKGKSNILLLQ